jgi:hypothetical protein
MGSFGVCIGINNYPGTDSDLSGCVNDAKDWQEVLDSRGFKTDVLLDGDATWQNMTDAIREGVQTAEDGDLVVIEYSGHGSYVPDVDGDEPDARDEVLCPHDIFEQRPLIDDQLYEIFSEKRRGARIVLIADSCHSGSVAKLMPPIGEDGPRERIRFMPPAAWLDEKKLAKARSTPAFSTSRRRPNAALLLAGCQDWQTSADAYLDGRYNGAFTYYALQALKEVPDGSTYGDWFKGIRKYLPNQRYDQRPNLMGSTRMKGWGIFQTASP